MLSLITILLIVFVIWLIGHFAVRFLGLQIQWPLFHHLGHRLHIFRFYRELIFAWQNEDPSRIPKQVMIIFISFIIIIGGFFYILALLSD